MNENKEYKSGTYTISHPHQNPSLVTIQKEFDVDDGSIIVKTNIDITIPSSYTVKGMRVTEDEKSLVVQYSNDREKKFDIRDMPIHLKDINNLIGNKSYEFVIPDTVKKQSLQVLDGTLTLKVENKKLYCSGHEIGTRVFDEEEVAGLIAVDESIVIVSNYNYCSLYRSKSSLESKLIELINSEITHQKVQFKKHRNSFYIDETVKIGNIKYDIHKTMDNIEKYLDDYAEHGGLQENSDVLDAYRTLNKMLDNKKDPEKVMNIMKSINPKTRMALGVALIALAVILFGVGITALVLMPGFASGGAAAGFGLLGVFTTMPSIVLSGVATCFLVLPQSRNLSFIKNIGRLTKHIVTEENPDDRQEAKGLGLSCE